MLAWKKWREGTVSNIVDSTLNDGSSNEIMRCIHIGLLCVQENVANRPTMATIMLMLSSYSVTLQIPSEPAFFMHSSPDILSLAYDSREKGSSKSKSTSLQESSEEVSITQQMNWTRVFDSRHTVMGKWIDIHKYIWFQELCQLYMCIWTHVI